MLQIIFLIFLSIIVGVSFFNIFISKSYIFLLTFLISLVCLLAFYLFQFGSLASFSLKALSAEANFIREKKQEVAQDAEAVDAIKRQVEQLLSYSRKSQQEIENTKNEIIAVQKELAETAQMARPPSLVLAGQEIEKLPSGYKLTLRFTPSKNVPLGLIVFVATVIDDSDVRILDFWPSLKGGSFSSGDESKKIREDGKQARLEYSLISAGQPTFDLTLSRSCKIKIEGNYIKDALIIASE